MYNLLVREFAKLINEKKVRNYEAEHICNYQSNDYLKLLRDI